jgi:hypothetical protein
MLKMFLRQCTLRLVRSAKFPCGGTNMLLARGLNGLGRDTRVWWQRKPLSSTYEFSLYEIPTNEVQSIFVFITYILQINKVHIL